MSEHLRKVLIEAESNLAMARDDLAIMRANLVKARADLTLEKKKREVKAAMTKEKLVKVKREAEATTGKYKASPNFIAKMAQVVVAFQALKEFSNACVTFSHEA